MLIVIIQLCYHFPSVRKGKIKFDQAKLGWVMLVWIKNPIFESMFFVLKKILMEQNMKEK